MNRFLLSLVVGTLLVGTRTWSAPEATPPPPAPAPAATKDRREIDQTAREELIRLQERQLAAAQLIREGQSLYNEGKYEPAIEKFDAALKMLPRARATEIDYNQALDGLNRTYYRLAEAALKAGNPTKAKQLAQKALEYNPGSRAAESILVKAQRADEQAKFKVEHPPLPLALDETPDFKSKQDRIKNLFREGKILLNSGQYDDAERRFQQILLIDPYNADARLFLEELNRQRLQIATVAGDASRNQRLWEVTQGWVPPLGRNLELPKEATTPGLINKESVSTVEITKKLNTIILPEVNLRDAVITDVVRFLSEESRRLDDPSRTGVNIVLQLGGNETAGSAPSSIPAMVPTAPAMPVGGGVPPPMGGMAPPLPAPAAPAAEVAPAEVPPSNAPASGEIAGARRVTVSLRSIPLIEALKYVTAAAGLKFRVEPHAVIILPKDTPEGEMVTRSYPVASGAIKNVIAMPSGGAPGGGGGGAIERLGGEGKVAQFEDVKKFFTDAGVPFPAGSSLAYNDRTSTIIIRNTPDNLETFERILGTLNVIPSQIEIEAKFIDIAQSDLDELGFKWSVGQYNTGDYQLQGGSPALPTGGGTTTSSALQSITPGLRDSTVIRANAIDSLLGLGGAGSPANVGTLAGILTNPQFQMVITALSQKKSTDVLSAPKITTISGSAAQMKVVQEFIYPTEYEAPQVAQQATTPPIPSGFKTREVGVLLNVTPTVGADGYTINLTLIPEVSEFLGFIDYSPGNSTSTTFQQTTTGGPSVPITTSVPNKIQQPLFSSRNLATSIVIWDGQTVVLGGLLSENVDKIDDKVPFLGDIPLLGRLFRSKITVRTKRNLLIFVTARLIDPAGNPIHRAEAAAAR